MTSHTADRILDALAGDGPISERLMIVVAHPDDETIGVGAQLWRMRDALLLHVTDGAPRDGEDARRYGFIDLGEYAHARRRELAAALAAGEAAQLRRMAFAVPDKEAFLDLVGVTRRLGEVLRREEPAAVLTHAYEGGHPDHDAAAFIVHAACRLLQPGKRPAVIEMALYHGAGDHGAQGGLVAGCFLPGETREVVCRPDPAGMARKRRMIDCFATQRQVLDQFRLGPERFREAAAYDFEQPPHAGPLLYEHWGWGITGADWRRRAAAALAELSLA